MQRLEGEDGWNVPYPQKQYANKPADSPDRLLRDRQAVELRMAGATFQEIASQLGYTSTDACYEAVNRFMDRLHYETADQMRKMQHERLNAMLLSLWPKVQRGDTGAISQSLSIMDRLNRLLGVEEQIEAVEQEKVHIDNVVVAIPVTATSRDFISALRAARGEDPSTMDLSDVIEVESREHE